MYTAFARTHALTHANMFCITNFSIIYTSVCNLFVLFQWPLPFLSYTRARILTYTRTHFTRSYICICTLPAYTCTHTRCTRCCIHTYTHTRCTLSLFTHILKYSYMVQTHTTRTYICPCTHLARTCRYLPLRTYCTHITHRLAYASYERHV